MDQKWGVFEAKKYKKIFLKIFGTKKIKKMQKMGSKMEQGFMAYTV